MVMVRSTMKVCMATWESCELPSKVLWSLACRIGFALASLLLPFRFSINMIISEIDISFMCVPCT